MSPRRGPDNIKIQKTGANAGFYAEIPSASDLGVREMVAKRSQPRAGILPV